MASHQTVGDLQALATAVLDERRRLGLTQEELVRRVDRGLSESSLYRIENARDPDVAVSRTVLRALDVALGWDEGRARSIYNPNLGRTAERVDGTFTAVEPMPAPADVVAAIEADPNLLPEAKAHLVSQYGLLLRVAATSPSASTDRPSATDEPHLRAVARRGTPRAKRDTHDDGGSA